MSFKKVWVCAIDFGTTLSGYAFALLRDLEENPLDTYQPLWKHRDSYGVPRKKTSSVVLLTPNKTFHAFGYEAEEKYADLKLNHEHEGWLYFKRSKMNPHQIKSLRRTTTIKDVNGEEMPAMTIFTMAIKYLKDHLMDTLRSRVTDFTEDFILWVVTVPAIWDDGAKQFMMEAAAEAGIPRDQLLLVSEPEAAFLYCNLISMKAMLENKGRADTDLFQPGTQYIILDSGGTSDITVLAVQSNRTLREVHHATSGTWGRTKVNDAFYQFLVKLFGNDALTKFKNEYIWDYTYLFSYFEMQKCTIMPSSKEVVRIPIPFSLVHIVEKQTQKKSGRGIATDQLRRYSEYQQR